MLGLNQQAHPSGHLCSCNILTSTVHAVSLLGALASSQPAHDYQVNVNLLGAFEAFACHVELCCHQLSLPHAGVMAMVALQGESGSPRCYWQKICNSSVHVTSLVSCRLSSVQQLFLVKTRLSSRKRNQQTYVVCSHTLSVAPHAGKQEYGIQVEQLTTAVCIFMLLSRAAGCPMACLAQNPSMRRPCRHPCKPLSS